MRRKPVCLIPVPASTRPACSLLPWLLALALLLSVGVNVYCLTPGDNTAQSRIGAATAQPVPADDDADDEEQDRTWAALAEELRQTRQQLAACQGQVAATPAGH